MCKALDRTEVFGEDMMGFQDDIKTIKQYNEFFQLRHTPDHTSSPSFSNIPLNVMVYICDFEGWSTCLLTEATLVEDYANRYHFCVETDEADTYVTIWCWKLQCLDAGEDHRTGQWGTGSSIEGRRGDCKIHELFKAVHAPTGTACFDEWG